MVCVCDGVTWCVCDGVMVCVCVCVCVRLRACAQDRHHLGLSSAAFSHVPLVYILTLGVTRDWQKRGIAKLLLQHVQHRAQMMRCDVLSCNT